jgi:hypothetical protein
MLSNTVAVFVASLICLVSGLLGQAAWAQSSAPPAWELPHGRTVTDDHPRSYRFTVDYNTANSKGEIILRQRLTGEYTRGLANGEVVWNNVALANAEGPTSAFATAEKQTFMEGFRYPNDLSATMKPDFFKAFPPTAVIERNLVWDTGMIEQFGQNFFEKLKLNQPYHSASADDVNMPGVGTFQNRDLVLEWIGRSQRNGQDCALIEYRAFLNPLEIVNGGMTLKGRSEYWGQIWVSLATKQIEYATLYENVGGELQLAGQNTPQVISVFRIGTLEPLNSK